MTLTDYFAWLGPIYLLAVAWPLSVVDIRERRLPNKFTLPAFPITLFGQLIAVCGGADATRLLLALLAGVLAFSACLALNRYAGLGMGDVKLISAITFALVWFSPLLPAIAVAIALALAGVVALGMIIRRKANMGSSIALGPYLLAGYVVTLIFQALP
jgi:leader peptidase (prepilin peptidase) / N-methyltransferase